MFNVFQSLAQIQLIDETTGQPRTLISSQQFKKMVEDILGITLKEQEAILTPQQDPNNPNVKPINENPNIPNANMQGQNKGGVPVVQEDICQATKNTSWELAKI